MNSISASEQPSVAVRRRRAIADHDEAPPMRPLLPLPAPEKVKAVTIEVNCELYMAARQELRARRVTVRRIMEWALANYLLNCNPEEAKRLGIDPA